MKLAIISTLFGADHGGSEELWMKMAQDVVRKGHEVTAYVYVKKKMPTPLQKTIDAGVKVVYRKHQAIPRNPLLWAIYMFKRKVLRYNPYRQINSFNPDLIYVNQAGSIDAVYDTNLKNYLLAAGKPYHLNPHQISEEDTGAPDPVLANEVRKVFDGAKSLIFISNRNKNTLYKKWGLSNTQTYITCNPLNIQTHQLLELPSTEGTINFATVAFLNVSQKGHDIVIRLLSSDKWKSRNWKYNIYGSGPDESYLRSLVNELGLQDKVIFHGHTTDITGIWKGNHVHLLCSFREGMPIAICESLSLGRIAVITDVGGVTEWVTDGHDGYIAERADEVLFDNALERAWNDRDRWEEMSRNAYESFNGKYNRNYAEDLWNYITRS